MDHMVVTMTLFGYTLIKKNTVDELDRRLRLYSDEQSKLQTHIQDLRRETLKVQERKEDLQARNDKLNEQLISKNNTIKMLRDKLDTRPELNDVREVIDEMRKRYPDKMLIDDFTAFERGKLAGHIEIIEEIEMLIAPEPEHEEADDGDPRY